MKYFNVPMRRRLLRTLVPLVTHFYGPTDQSEVSSPHITNPTDMVLKTVAGAGLFLSLMPLGAIAHGSVQEQKEGDKHEQRPQHPGQTDTLAKSSEKSGKVCWPHHLNLRLFKQIVGPTRSLIFVPNADLPCTLSECGRNRGLESHNVRGFGSARALGHGHPYR